MFIHYFKVSTTTTSSTTSSNEVATKDGPDNTVFIVVGVVVGIIIITVCVVVFLYKFKVSTPVTFWSIIILGKFVLKK